MKKALSLILAVSIFMCVSVFAESDHGLEEAIRAVKNVIEIPEEYSDFDYNSHTSADRSVWALEWSGEGGYAAVSVTGEGEILNYYSYNRNDSNSEWANITAAEAQAMAEEFIKKVNPSLAPQLVLVSKQSYSGNMEFCFAETIDGIKLYNRYTYVTVDRVNKKVTSYSSDGKTKKTAVPLEGVISPEAAIAAYTEKLGAEIVYLKKYDNLAKEVSTYPVYRLKETQRIAIDALSGGTAEYKPSENEDYYSVGSGSNGAMKDEAEDSEAGLSPEEIKAIDTVSGLMSLQEAEEALKSIFPSLEGLVPASISLSKQYYTDKFTYNVRYRSDSFYASARMDAASGELISWSGSGDSDFSESITDSEAEAIAKAFLDKNAAEKLKLCGEPEESSYGEDTKKYYTFTANRMANGAMVEGERISLTVNPDGQISYYSMAITDTLSFESVENAIDEKSAVTKIAELAGYELIYVYSGEQDKYIPVYEFVNKHTTVHPVTGQQTQLSEPEPVKPESYSDISGHWAEEIINTLLDNGYYIEGDSFNPDAPVSVKEFLVYARFAGGYSDDEIKLVMNMLEPDKYQSGESADINSVLTRQTAAKLIATNMGYGEIAAYSEIFRYPFCDASEVPKEYIGYVSICFAKNIFKGDSLGNFNPQKSMTRAEAAAVIYNYYSGR